MRGDYVYRDSEDQIQTATDSESIPANALDLIRFVPEGAPPPPHTEADHAKIEAIRDEFARVYELIYKRKPPSRRTII